MTARTVRPAPPRAVCVMNPVVADLVLPEELRERLSALVTLAPDPVLAPEAEGPGAEGSDGDAFPAALADAEILVSGWGCPRLTADVLARAPRLRAVVHAAGSVKSLVSEAVWERGIVVSSAADANAGPVVSHTVALVTLAARRTLTLAAGYAAGYAEGWPAFESRAGADGVTVGIVGASRIGRRVIAELARSDAGYRVLLSDPHVTDEEARRLGARRVPLAELCRESRVVSVHAPLLPETTGLLDAGMLDLIPDGGAVINTARGAIVDTDALIRACSSGRLEAYLDVTDPEPLPPGHPLLALPNVLVTPHMAGAQGSEVRRLGQYAVAEVRRWVAGEPLLGEVTPEALPRLA
ncbi:hydroxyacid dehydrogenase [Streptomyces sp. NPDC091292]|uniref:hydroxyacid dehydrogenase n=1 Tax=Streptomyces sp. NPDC091292 TaxID=3365991 RepID=UPI00381A436B